MQPQDYIATTALVTHEVITMSIKRTYPWLNARERDEMIIDVIDQLARMRGWSVRRESVHAEDEGE